MVRYINNVIVAVATLFLTSCAEDTFEKVDFQKNAQVPSGIVTPNVVANYGDMIILGEADVTSDNGSVIMSKGICWSKSNIPTVDDFVFTTSDLQGTGLFTAVLGNLELNTKYYYCTFAQNLKGVAYGEVKEVVSNSIALRPAPYSCDFSAAQRVGWTQIDKDGDGNLWGFVVLGDKLPAAISYSYTSAAGALTPENYLLSPPIVLTGGEKIYWKVSSLDKTYFEESYKVIVSPEPITMDNVSSITPLFEETLTADAGAGFLSRSVEIPSGHSMVYIAICHFDSFDNYAILIRDFEVK